MVKTLINMKEYLREEIKPPYYVVWEQIENYCEETAETSTEEYVKVVYGENEYSSLIPICLYMVEGPGQIDAALNRLREENRCIFING